MRTYQFTSDLCMDAEHLGLPQTAALLATDGVSRAAQTGNLQIEAYAWEVVGREWLKANGLKQAESAFSEADRVLGKLGENQATRTYRADWAADRAKLALSQHDDSAATAGLESAMSIVDATNDLFIEEKYWTNRSEIERRMGRTDAAWQSASRAVELSESALLKIQDLHKRAAWQRMSEAQYKSLVEALLLKHQERQALQEWLWYRSAAERPAGAEADSQADYEGGHPGQHEMLPNTTVLVYVRLPDKYVILAPKAGSGNVRAIQVAADPNYIDDMVRTYSILCSDPQSNIGELRALGAALYSILLAPAISNNVEELRLDLPSSLMRVPFETLVMPSGDYLGSKLRIVSLSPDWGFHRLPTATVQSLTSRLLLVDAQAADSGSLRIPEQYDESNSLRALFPARQLHSMKGSAGLKEVLSALQSATAFHFVGHAETTGGTVHLLLGDTNASGSFLDASAIERVRLKHCKIAFLAACSTSGSPRALDEGATLPLAFVRAGTEDVVSSRWDIDSEASSRLAILFYRSLRKGKSPAEALKQAEETVRNVTRFQHPYYWACFSLMER